MVVNKGCGPHTRMTSGKSAISLVKCYEAVGTRGLEEGLRSVCHTEIMYNSMFGVRGGVIKGRAPAPGDGTSESTAVKMPSFLR